MILNEPFLPLLLHPLLTYSFHSSSTASPHLPLSLSLSLHLPLSPFSFSFSSSPSFFGVLPLPPLVFVDVLLFSVSPPPNSFSSLRFLSLLLSVFFFYVYFSSQFIIFSPPLPIPHPLSHLVLMRHPVFLIYVLLTPFVP